jgi:formylglycine-generating enzyme required for sulfatase activity
MKRARVLWTPVLLLALCACSPPRAAEAARPTIEIVSPPSGTRLAQGEEIEVESRAGDTRGVDRVELWVDDQIYRVDEAGAQPSFHIIQRWRADTQGEHRLRVQAINVDAQTSQPAIIIVEVLDPAAFTATPAPMAVQTPTEAAAPSPTATEVPPPTATATVPAPTLTATPTPTPTLQAATPELAAPCEMISIPAGTFLMGSNDDAVQKASDWCGCGRKHFEDELYMHEVYVSAFAIDKYETTNRQFDAFVRATRYLTDAERKPEANTWRTAYAPGEEDHPVVWMSWNDANAYCMWAGKRLPTEAEWEKAARGGDARLWPWGSEWDSARANTADGERKATTLVGSFPAGASPYGPVDMAGNVWEWVNDWHSPFYYQSGADHSRDPIGPKGGQDRVLRGGGFNNGMADVRTANRHKGGMAGYAPDHGFRCAK